MPAKNTKKFMPKANILAHKKNIKEFFYWMYERQNIWYNRFILQKERPWTKDKILDEYKFTNTYRELDRNTLWLIHNVIRKKNDPKNMLWKIIVFRYFNKPELFDYMNGIPDFDNFNPKEFNIKVVEYKKKYGRVFTDAYLINPPKNPIDRKLGMELFYCKHINVLHKKMNNILWKGYEKLEDPAKFNLLLKKELHCIANFLAYEIYCDLCYTDWFKWTENDFVNVGLGSKFGVELLFPFTSEKGGHTRMLYFLKENSEYFFKKYNFVMKYYNENSPKDFKNGKKMTLRTIEHSLCEYSKYFKDTIKVGKQSKKFIIKKD